jgi:hypothetical protein
LGAAPAMHRRGVLKNSKRLHMARKDTLAIGEMPEKTRRRVLEILAAAEQARQWRAAELVKLAAREGRGEARHIEDADGGGYVQMRINATSFHYWGQRLGYECWNDPQFCREYLRDNEYARVRSRPANARFGYRAPAQPVEGIFAVHRGSCREIKRYG